MIIRCNNNGFYSLKNCHKTFGQALDISLEFKVKEGLIGKPAFQKVKPLTTLTKEVLQEENILSKEKGEQAKEAYLPVPLSHYWANAGHLLFMTMEANVHFMTRPAPTHPPALPDPLFITPPQTDPLRHFRQIHLLAPTGALNAMMRHS